MVERFHGMEEVRGSNPLSSTTPVQKPPAVATCRIDDLAEALDYDSFAIFGEHELLFFSLGKKPFEPIVKSSLHGDPAFPGRPYQAIGDDKVKVAQYVQHFSNPACVSLAVLRDHGYEWDEKPMSVGSVGSLQDGESSE